MPRFQFVVSDGEMTFLISIVPALVLLNVQTMFWPSATLKPLEMRLSP